MKYVLGIDQGGSKTHAVVSDETGKILGFGKSYGACHSDSSVEYAIQAVLEASDSALNQCGLKRGNVQIMIGGMTGVDWDYEAELLEEGIRTYFPAADIRVVNDCIIAMRAGTMRTHCGILCAGSGLNCAVQSGEERFVYGFYIADEYQGGNCLGKRTVQAVFDSHMGIVPRTILTEKVLAFFQAKSVDELLYRRVKGEIKGKDYLKLPILLEESLLEGDEVALDIWKEYGKEMVVFLTARMRIMDILDQKVDVVLSGSIFKCKSKEFQNVVKEEILNSIPNANIIAAEYEPVVGAVLMGLKKLTGQVLDSYYENLKEAAKIFPIRRLKV